MKNEREIRKWKGKVAVIAFVISFKTFIDVSTKFTAAYYGNDICMA